MKNIREINIWKEKPQDETMYRTALESADILDLCLGQRAYNALKRSNCSTVGDVMALIREDGAGLKKVRNLGEKSEREILEKLQILSETYKKESAVYTPATGGIAKKVLMMPNGRTWNRDINSYDLSETTLSRLKDCGIRKVGDIYAPLRQDPGWKAIRELFDKIISDAS